MNFDKNDQIVHFDRTGKKLLRFDRPRADREGSRAETPAQRDSVAESPRWIAQILKAIRPDLPDRRNGVRHEAHWREVWVGWWSGDQFNAVRGRVRDLSRGGAKVVLGVRPPRKQPVWVYKEVDETLAFVRGEVAGAMPAPNSQYAVRFRFTVPCPTVLFQAVVCEQPGERRPER